MKNKCILVKKSNLQAVILAGTALCAILMLRDAESLSAGIRDGIALCCNNVIPSLFPFLILSAFIGNMGICVSEKNLVSRCVLKLFGVPNTCITTIMMSFIGGYPAGIKLIIDLKSRGMIDAETATMMTAFCFNSGPAFLITAVGRNMFTDKTYGIVLFICVSAASVLTGVIAAAKTKHSCRAVQTENRCDEAYAQMFLAAVARSTDSMLHICVWICIFSGISALAKSFFGDLPYQLAVFAEVTDGCMLCSKQRNLPLTAAACAFGGFCVHLQLLPDLKKLQIKYRYFFKYRVIHSVLSYLFCYLYCIKYPITATASSMRPTIALRANIPQIVILMLLCIAFVFDTLPHREKRRLNL